MNEQTTMDDMVAEEQPDFDADRDIVSYDMNQLDADDLYDVRIEAEELGAVALASRVEIERSNTVAHDGYRPSFGQHELLDIGMMLMSAKRYRTNQGREDRVERIQSLASAFLDGFDIDSDSVSMEKGDGLPTIDDMATDEE
jgi:hypothetical protein